MQEKYVYHGSNVPNLRTLIPHKCKHEKAYVYATKSYITVLLFATKGQGMFDGWLENDENGVPTFYETYPNSFSNRYAGKKSYCYKLSDRTFTSATGDPTEVVSELPVDVIEEIEIKDVGAEFKKLEKKGKFKVVKYGTSNKNTPEICKQRILKILIDRGFFEGNEFRQKEWCATYFKDLIKSYQKGEIIVE